MTSCCAGTACHPTCVAAWAGGAEDGGSDAAIGTLTSRESAIRIHGAMIWLRGTTGSGWLNGGQKRAATPPPPAALGLEQRLVTQISAGMMASH